MYTHPLLDPDSPLSQAPDSVASPARDVEPQQGGRNRRTGPDLLAQVPAVCSGLAWVLLGVAWMCWDRSAPRRHGVDALVGVREHAIVQGLDRVALVLLVVVVLLSLAGLWARSLRGRRRTDTWPVSLIVLGCGATVGAVALLVS